MRDNFNKTQQHLIEMSERAHEVGFRHRGLSGTICENLLTEALRKDVPDFSFDRGIISFATDPTSNPVNSKNLSPQLDIIIYKGKPAARIGDLVIIHESQARGIIEVKKWLYPHSLFRAQAQLEQIKRLTDQLLKTKHEIVPFLVTFRFHDRQRVECNWFTETKDFGIKNRYCFSGKYSSINGTNLYPWQEKWWNNFEKYEYAGQYKRLVKDIKDLQGC